MEEEDDAREGFVNRSVKSDDGEDSKSVHSTISRVPIAWRLREIASRFRRIKDAPPPPGSHDPDKDNITALQRHLDMMEWVTDLFNRVPSDTASSVGEEPERFIYIPKLHGVKWRDLQPPPPPPPPFVPGADEPVHHTDYAVSFLTQEIPIRRRMPGANWVEEVDEVSPPTDIASERPEGVKSLPPVIYVNSLATRRLLTSITEVSVNVDAPRGQLVIYRPFKILVHFDSQIRKQLDEIDDLVAKAAPGPPNANNDVEADSLGKDDDERLDTENIIGETQSDGSSFVGPPNRVSLFRPASLKHHTYKELQEARADFATLVDFMDTFLLPLRKALENPNNMRVNFNELWHLYMPGSLVYVKDSGVPQKLWRVIQGTDGIIPGVRPIVGHSHPSFYKLGGMTDDGKSSP